MAADGLRLTDFYAQPICGPSRTSFMTGCNPLRVAERGNVKEFMPVLHECESTLGGLLQEAGYATAMFGKGSGRAQATSRGWSADGPLADTSWF